MTNTFKQKLLLGTALVAVGAFASASAHAVDLVGNSTYGTTAPVNAPTSGVAIDLKGFDLTVNDTNVTTIGAITDTGATPDGNILVTSETLNADITLTIGSIDNGTGNFTVQSLEADNSTVAVTVSGVTDVGGNLVVTNATETSNADTITLTLTGNATITGTTGVTAGGLAGGGTTATLNVDGASNTFNGAVTITGGAGNAANDATLALSGAATTFTNGLTLTDGASGQALLLVDGLTVAQTITGNIAGNGDITVQNAAGATFNGTVTSGTIVIENGGAALASAATFTKTVNVTSITLGAAGTGTNTATFNTTGGDFTVTGTVDGAIAGETNAVVISGGNTLTTASAWGGVATQLDSVTLSGTGTELALGANLTAAAIDLGSGTTLTTSSAATIDGDINGTTAGSGVLDINAATTIEDNVGATKTIASADVASGITLTLNPDAGTATYATASGINLNDDGIDNGTNTILAISNTAADVLTFNTAITTSFDGEGKVTIADQASTVDFNGNIGTSSKALESVAVTAGGNAAVVTSSGNWYVDTTTIGNGDTLRFDGTSAQTVSGTIDGTGAGLGALIVGNTGTKSSVTFDGKLGTTTATLASFTVFDDSTAIVNGSTNTVAGNVTVDGNLRLSQGVLFNADDVAVGTAAGVLEFVIGTTAAGVDQAATLDLAQAVNWDEFDGTTANSHDTLLKQGTGVILNGQDFLLIDGTGAVTNLAVAGETVDDEYALFNFKAYDGATKVLGAPDNSDVIVEATHADTGSVTINSNNANAADGILDVSVAEYAADTDGTNELALVYDSVTRATTDQIDERLEAIQPTVDGGNIVAATTVSNITSNIIQLASTDAEGSGIAAGNISNGLRAWAQVFGQTGEQDDRDGIDGYDVDTYGFAVGLDTQALADQMVIGLAFSYADTEVDSSNANNTTTEIDSYQVTLYGTYNIDEATYVSGQLGYAFGDNSTRRNNLGGVATVDANGDFDSNQFIARLEAGRAYEVGAITTLTPKLMVNYNHYDADSYTETGAGGAGLEVDQDTNNIFEIGAGVDADWMFQQADGSYIKPQVRAGVRYDLADDQVEATSSLIGGGAAFETEGFDPQSLALDVGAGVTYFSTTNWELTANYDFEYKEDYNSHAGFLRAAYKF